MGLMKQLLLPKHLIIFILVAYLPLLYVLFRDHKDLQTHKRRFDALPHETEEDILERLARIVNQSDTLMNKESNQKHPQQRSKIDYEDFKAMGGYRKPNDFQEKPPNPFRLAEKSKDTQDLKFQPKSSYHEKGNIENMKQNIGDVDPYAKILERKRNQYMKRSKEPATIKQDENVRFVRNQERMGQNFEERFDFALNMLKNDASWKKHKKKVNPTRPPPPKKKTPVSRPEITEAKVVNGVPGNYEVEEPVVMGPGERGASVRIRERLDEQEKSMHEYGFNMLVSDVIALNRTLRDSRPVQCRYWQYADRLPSASVVIVLHNEGWSTLLRTVHSVMRTSPAHLLHEILLVDDASTKKHLKSQLDNYVQTVPALQGKVRVVHSETRLGLIRARTYGAERARGQVLVFLDAHCECNHNWLPPLLSRIAQDRTIITVPIIDGIDARTFEYRAIYQQPYRGIWEWGFFYKEYMVSREEIKTWEYPTSPYKSPTNAGGLFAIDREYFKEMGYYDAGLEIWGGENFELSFKVWMCGGSVEWVPCSRVGHLYRAFMPYGMGDKSGPVSQINYLRVIETWMDDKYKEYFYTREPTFRGVQYGDISKQLEFKKTHNCKSFDWFMNNVAQDVLSYYPPPPKNLRWGEIKEATGDLCWDTKDATVYRGFIQLSTCMHRGGKQLFRLNIEGQLGYGEYCVNLQENHVTFALCKRGTVDGPWVYDTDTGLLRHKTRDKCMASNQRLKQLELEDCDAGREAQHWHINQVYPFRNLMSPQYLQEHGIKI